MLKCDSVLSVMLTPLDAVWAEAIATPTAPALGDQCHYCHNSTEVIGAVQEENLAPIYPSWILYSQVIQYPIDFPFCHFSTLCNQKCPLSYDPILLLGILCCFSIWYNSCPPIRLIFGALPFRALTKGDLGNRFPCVSVASLLERTSWFQPEVSES